MPAGMTHLIFDEEVYARLSNDTKKDLPNYKEFSIMAQGHDGYIYPDFKKPWRMKKNKIIADLLQEKKFQESIYQYINIAKNNGKIENEQVRLFIYKYIEHHMLDAYTHPFIIYHAGDHKPIKGKATWDHGNIEAILDSYIVEKKKNMDLKTFDTTNEFVLKKQIDYDVVDTINKMFIKTYEQELGRMKISDAGDRLISVYEQYALFMKLFRNDPDGKKKNQYEKIERYLPSLIGIKSFSNYVDSSEAYDYLNLEHQQWVNPTDIDIVSTESFIDLYEKAQNKSIDIIEGLEKYSKTNFNKDDIYSLIPDVSALSGLSCDVSFEIENTKEVKTKKITKKSGRK